MKPQETKRNEHELIPPIFTINTWEHSPWLIDTMPDQGTLQKGTRVCNCKCGQIHPVDTEGNPNTTVGLCTTCRVIKNIGTHGLEPDGCSNCFLIGCL